LNRFDLDYAIARQISRSWRSRMPKFNPWRCYRKPSRCGRSCDRNPALEDSAGSVPEPRVRLRQKRAIRSEVSPKWSKSTPSSSPLSSIAIIACRRGESEPRGWLESAEYSVCREVESPLRYSRVWSPQFPDCPVETSWSAGARYSCSIRGNNPSIVPAAVLLQNASQFGDMVADKGAPSARSQSITD